MLSQRSIISSRIYRCDVCVKRYKNRSPEHWANKLRKTNPANLALKHFDETYQKMFKHEWPSVRLALLTQNKYVALVNNFGDVEQTMEQLENLGALNVRQVYDIHREKLKEKEENKKKSTSSSTTNKEYKESLMKMTQNIEDIEDTGQDAKNEIRRGRPKEEEEDEEEDSVASSERAGYSYRNQSLQASMDSAELDKDRMVSPRDTASTGLQDFIPATQLKGMDEFLTDAELMESYRPSDEVDFKTVPEKELHISPYLQAYTFPIGDISEFPAPRRGVTGVFNYYCMDGASLVPVLALNVQPYDTVLDMCAAPGGKSLVALQTLYPDLIVANDMERSKRLINMFSQFIYDFNPRTDKRLQITNRNGVAITEENTYDKILVDVPCTNDRLSVTDDFNNLFNPMKLKQRLTLPETQADLLTQALKLVKVGGSVVYSTCSLSPIQNDGVVHMTMKRIWEETKCEIEIKDLSEAIKPLRSIYSFANIKMSYGHLIKPYLPANFGPMYFCKFDKVS
uniref:NOL1/NOP2/Sun domain family member 4 n=1 Tax=Cacopsylla melanoneura TaxID=428564 RepID=A0A8D8M1X6_9HEMI